jgi:hypothetical protein
MRSASICLTVQPGGPPLLPPSASGEGRSNLRDKRVTNRKPVKPNTITYIQEFFKIILVVLHSSQEEEARGHRMRHNVNANTTFVLKATILANFQEL